MNMFRVPSFLSKLFPKTIESESPLSDALVQAAEAAAEAPTEEPDADTLPDIDDLETLPMIDFDKDLVMLDEMMNSVPEPMPPPRSKKPIIGVSVAVMVASIVVFAGVSHAQKSAEAAPKPEKVYACKLSVKEGAQQKTNEGKPIIDCSGRLFVAEQSYFDGERMIHKNMQRIDGDDDPEL